MDSYSWSFREFMISMIHSKVSFTCNIYKSIISSPSIRIEYRFIKVYFSSNYRPQCICLTVWDYLCIYFYSSMCIFSFYKAKYWLLQGSSSSFELSRESSLSLCSEITLINFYFSSYLFLESIHSVFIDDLPKYAKVSIYCIRI